MLLLRLVIGLLALAAALAAAHAAYAPKVGIIGAGIGGGSVAYYLASKYGHSNCTTVFETRDYIGGRLKHITIDNQTIEIGGDAWSSVNLYVKEIAKDLKLPVDAPEQSASGNEALDPFEALLSRAIRGEAGVSGVSGEQLGVWTGNSWVNLRGTLLEHLFSDLGTAEALTAFLVRLRENYVIRDDFILSGGQPFQDIDGFLKPGTMNAFTNMSSADLFSMYNIVGAIQDDAIIPIVRVIYDQEKAAHAFATLVSLTSLIDAYSVSTGNSKLVEAMFQRASSDVKLNSQVQSITDTGAATGRFVVSYASTSTGNVFTEAVDQVVIAAPVEFTGIRFVNMSVSFTPRTFVHWYVTIIVAKAVNPGFFNESASFVVPQAVLTTQASAATTPFNVLQYLADANDGYHIYKIFSNDWVNATLPSLFVDIREFHVQVWPYTFPTFQPTPSETTKFQPIQPHPGVFYLNTMESVASAMECSIIAGRNIANLVHKSL